MNCVACRSLLQRELDGEPRIDGSRLEAHLRACGDCRAFRAGLRRLAEFAARQPVAPPPADFAARMTALVLADRVRPEPAPVPSRPSRTWLLALAASLLVGLGFLGWTLTPRDGRPEPIVVIRPPETPPETLRESMREAGSALANLTSKTADEMVERTRHLLPSVTPPSLPAIEPSATSLTQAGSAVAEGFEPVTNSARRAFDLFLRDVPRIPDANPGL